MQIREMNSADLDRLIDIDATIDSMHYLHLDSAGEGLKRTWTVEPRPLRERLIDRNALGDDTRFDYRQVVTGIDDGFARVADYSGNIIASLLARPDPLLGVLRITDLRADFDYRRQGLGTALVYQAIARARELELRAVTADTAANNHPAAEFMLKLGFELSGLDLRRRSNHDVVKECATLVWYATLD